MIPPYIKYRELLYSIILLILGWLNQSSAILDFCIGLGLFYFIFKLWFIVLSGYSLNDKKLLFLISRYNLFLLIKGTLFLFLLVYIDYDFFREFGDWVQYHHDGVSFSNSLRGLAVFSPMVPYSLAYSYLLGSIYYLFHDSILLGVIINIFFTVTSSIILYLFVEKIFNNEVAKYSLYLSLIYPKFLNYEIVLLKECFIFFTFVSLLFVTFRLLNEKKKIDILLFILLSVIMLNLRFFLLSPFLIYIIFHYVIVVKDYKKIILVFSLGLGGLFFIIDSKAEIKKGTLADAVIGKGFSIMDKSGTGSFNYQIKLSPGSKVDPTTKVISENPMAVLNILFSHSNYFIKRITLFYTSALSGQRVYYVPFLSENYVVAKWWVFNIITYLESLFSWTFMLVTLWGFKRMIINNTKKTAIIWIPILLIPLIVALVSNNFRYIFPVIYGVIPCIAYGIVYCKRYKEYLLLAGVVIFILIMGVNSETVIFYPIISVLIILLFQKILHRDDNVILN